MGTAIVWFRRDLRLADNPALQAALDAGHRPLPVYIHDPDEAEGWAPGAASRAWLHRSLRALDGTLRSRGSRLQVLRGDSQRRLEEAVQASGAEAVFWNRRYEPALIARDARVKRSLRERGLRVESFNAALLREPWEVLSGQGTAYRVFTPFWRKVRGGLDAFGHRPLPTPTRLPGTPDLPGIEEVGIGELGLCPRPAWDAGFWEHWVPGEEGAVELLDAFLEGALKGYAQQRDRPDRIGTSRLSPHLHFGEISPWQILVRVHERLGQTGLEADIERYLAELGWREFSHHLLHHFPHSAEANLNPRFDRFAWVEPDARALAAWQQGRCGVPIVDAGMRELWRTGWMHNRVRMIVASFLTKNLRFHWLHGARWFWDTLLDADLANNTQGWQWSAGTGADAAPYFRVFNPVSQAQRFDPDGAYVRRWLPELARLPAQALAAPWEHPDLLRRLAPDYPTTPLVDLRRSREEALAAYRATA